MSYCESNSSSNISGNGKKAARLTYFTNLPGALLFLSISFTVGMRPTFLWFYEKVVICTLSFEESKLKKLMSKSLTAYV